jgi:hypothetical protein
MKELVISIKNTIAVMKIGIFYLSRITITKPISLSLDWVINIYLFRVMSIDSEFYNISNIHR